MSTEHQKYSTDNQSAAIRDYALKRGFEIVHANHGQGRRQGFLRLAIEAHVDISRRHRRIVGTVIGEAPTERLGIERPRQFMGRRRGQLDIVDASARHAQ